MAYCINCGRKLADDFEFCPECGQRIHPDAASAPFPEHPYFGATIICNRCGAAMPADALYCLNCGSQFNSTATVADDFKAIQKSIRRNARLGGEKRKKWVAMLLCIFFGWLGIHRFYEGKIATGILWMLSAGCVGIGWFCDIIYTAMTPSDNLWKYR